MGFSISCDDTATEARTGRLHTAHGAVKTPCFMPVATKAGVKTLASEELLELGVEAIISNALVLYLKPGVEVISAAGGLHAFMNFPGAIFTDSGGFQALRREFKPEFTKRGIAFRSPFDNSRHVFTPELCMEVQEALGSDVAMTLDDCPPYGEAGERYRASVERTTRWARACLSAHTREEQLLFAIAQGGTCAELRQESARQLAQLDFDGYGIGGLSIGEPAELMLNMLEVSLSALPEEKPRYLMGLGSPVEVLEAIARGVDIFDSAFPTRNARHSAVYTRRGKYSITKAKHLRSSGPLEEGCTCFTCRNYSRAYVSHLMRAGESLGMRLTTLHNLHFMQTLMGDARRAIEAGEFADFLAEFRRDFGRAGRG
ncbi:tRNA guanosine(34) transglycosylase Tgt [Candidatus Pyrohabitans sp.]